MSDKIVPKILQPELNYRVVKLKADDLYTIPKAQAAMADDGADNYRVRVNRDEFVISASHGPAVEEGESLAFLVNGRQVVGEVIESDQQANSFGEGAGQAINGVGYGISTIGVGLVTFLGSIGSAGIGACGYIGPALMGGGLAVAGVSAAAIPLVGAWAAVRTADTHRLDALGDVVKK
jgi:hypothetical protein